MSCLEHNNYPTIIRFWDQFRKSQEEAQHAMLAGDEFRTILEFAKKQKPKDDDDSRFCVFDIISDKYYREDFHSDILAFFLNPQEKHQYGGKGLYSFIEALNRYPKIKCSKENYHYAEVFREYVIPGGRVDILIKDDISRHVIVIENKINRAGDTPRQIPRYCEHLSEEGYIVDCAVYLPLDRFSSPDKSSWLTKDFQWEDLIVILPAYSESEYTNLVDHWLKIMAASDIPADCASIFRQYSTLVKKLSVKNMDNVAFNKFYDYLLQGNNLETANSLSSMMADLPMYLAQRIRDAFFSRCEPFRKVCTWEERFAVFEGCYIDGCFFKLDIGCDTMNFTIVFWTPFEDDFKSKFESLTIKEVVLSKGVHLFEDYTENGQFKISKEIPITCPIEPIVEAIMSELRKVAD